MVTASVKCSGQELMGGVNTEEKSGCCVTAPIPIASGGTARRRESSGEEEEKTSMQVYS